VSDSSGVGIHQVIIAASNGDAITNHALQARRILRELGPSEIYAYSIAPALADDVLPLWAYRPSHTRNLLLFHASMGQPEVHEFLDTRPEPIVLMYHNVTPARYYEYYDPAFADLLELGRREVERLRPRVVGAIAASAYNARELEAMGYRDVRVVPPTANLRRLANVEPRAETMHTIAALARPIMLSVGQLMPHKRPDFLVHMMHVAESYLGLEAILLLVGHQRLERYTSAVNQQILELNLRNVRVFGAVDERDLAAMYRSSHLFVTASEHEGFCLPLVEAMTFGMPIVARACAAIPETVGDAALLVPPEQGPSFYAEAVMEGLANHALRAALTTAEATRLAELEARPPDVAMVEALLEVV